MDAGVPQYLIDQARNLRKRGYVLADQAVRFGSPEMLSLLALRASAERCDYDALLAEMRAVLVEGVNAQTPRVDLGALAGVAWVRAAQPGPGGDYSEAADLYRALRLFRDAKRSQDGTMSLRDVDRLDAQTNLVSGHHEYVAKILPGMRLVDESRWMFRCDMLNPELSSPGGSQEDFLACFNELFAKAGAAPVALADEPGTLFDRVIPATTPPTVTDAGPLVTVVMSVFRPDQSLFTALRSLTSQTWPHLQILVIDDCSPPGYEDLIAEAVALDDRIEFHQMPVNGGTYKIRNRALELARGELVTFQDSDDWSHPERIERQVRVLLEDPRAVASLSRSIRVGSQLNAVKIGYLPTRRNMSSLMFRRLEILETLGGFDEVRKSGDAEFIDRLELVYGVDRVISLDAPLALVQLTDDSLSRGDFLLGWRDGNRVAYRHAFAHWHRKFAVGESPRIEPGAPRRFAVPPPFVGDSLDGRRYDVAVVSDWRDGLGRYLGDDVELRTLARAGLSVVPMHAEAPRHARHGRVEPSAVSMELRTSGAVDIPRWRDEVAAGLILINDPELMGYPRGGPVGLRGDRVVVRADYPPRTPDDKSWVYEPAAVEHQVRTLFGVEAQWLPATSGIASALVAAGASAVVREAELLGVAPVRRRLSRGRRGGSRPIIGTTGLTEDLNERPSFEELLALLPDDDAFDVRIRDASNALTPARQAQPEPPNWLVTTDQGLTSFLDQLDVFVGVAPNSWGPDLTWAAAMAIARGCVAVLDERYEPFFGPAALYYGDRSVRQIVEQLAQTEGAHETQQQAGQQWCADRLSADRFAIAVRALTRVEL